MKRLFSLLLFLALALPLMRAEEAVYAPTATYKFASRDTCDLFLDLYARTAWSDSVYHGRVKPTVLFVFGGGFVGGERSALRYLPWFKLMNDNGYQVITVDYRLGLKGVDMSFRLTKLLSTARATRHAVELAVEDLFDATAFVLENADSLGVDPANIVLAGSSAGAMTALAAEQEIVNGTALASVLPEDFNYAGVMSFAGAIISGKGRPKYKGEPCPQLLLHGDKDKTVNYNKMAIFKWGIYGTAVLTKILKKAGHVYNTYRYKDHGHDIADNFVPTWKEQKRFMEVNVLDGERRIIDACVDDPTVPKWEGATLDSLY